MNTKNPTKNRTPRANKGKFKNPLYVVTKKGKVVEKVDSLWDGVVKRLGLDPVIQFLETILNMIMENIGSFAFLQAIQSALDSFIQEIQVLTEQLVPNRAKKKAAAI